MFFKTSKTRQDKKPLPWFLLLGLILLPHPLAAGSEFLDKKKGKEEDLELPKLVKDNFAKWDIKKNGSLDHQELVALVESPRIEGIEAALLVTLLKNQKKGESISSAELLKLLENKEGSFSQRVQKNYHAIKSCSKELFAGPNEPSMSGAEQELGDCYLAAPLAALVNRNPAAVRAMFMPQRDGTLVIRWGSGLVTQIVPPTDGEMVLMEKTNKKNGRWHVALEKAYSLITEHKHEQKTGRILDYERTVNDLVGHGGHADDTMKVIASSQVRQERAMGKDPLPKIHQILSTIKTNKLLAVVHARVRDVPGIPGSHVNAVLDYDINKQVVHVFNQNGPRFNPKGQEGLTNGYTTKNGHFFVPLADFVKIWGILTYETGLPIHPNNAGGKGNDDNKQKKDDNKKGKGKGKQ